MIGSVGHVAIAGVLALAGVSGPTAADDQHRIDEALAASSLRMLESDFWSVGPGTRDDDFVSACLGGVDSPGRLAPMAGEVARGVSNVYLHQPDADARPEDGELVRLAIVVVDEASESALDWFVVLLGDQDTAECRIDEFLDAVEREPEVADLETAVHGDAVADIGIGDRSARFDLRITFSSQGSARQVNYSHLVGRAGNALVVLASATFGPGPFSDLDPEAELAAIVAELRGA